MKENQDARPTKIYVRLVLFILLFIGLTVAGVWWAATSAKFDWNALKTLATLTLSTQILLAFLTVGLLAMETFRFWIFGWAIGVRMRIVTAWDAAISNCFFAWVTPGSAMADPASIYMLGKGGVPWDAAALLTFVKSITSMVLCISLSMIFLAMGYGPDMNLFLWIPFVSGIGILSVLSAVMLLGAFWPDFLMRNFLHWKDKAASWRWTSGPRLTRIVDALYKHTKLAVDRLRLFRQSGIGVMLFLLSVHVVYYVVFIGTLIVLLCAFGATLFSGIIPNAVIYQGFTYVAPTPGGAGISEATAVLFFGEFLQPKNAVLAVVLYRSLTFYLQIIIGAIYLPFIGGIRGVMEYSSSQKD